MVNFLAIEAAAIVEPILGHIFLMLAAATSASLTAADSLANCLKNDLRRGSRDAAASNDVFSRKPQRTEYT
jgi:hypothetical protein